MTDTETKEVFYDKLTFIYLEMPKFNKTAEESEARFVKWLYVIRNLNRLDRVPEKLPRVLKNSLDTAKQEAREQMDIEISRELLNISPTNIGEELTTIIQMES